jgi:hypothetical protein
MPLCPGIFLRAGVRKEPFVKNKRENISFVSMWFSVIDIQLCHGGVKADIVNTLMNEYGWIPKLFLFIF